MWRRGIKRLGWVKNFLFVTMLTLGLPVCSAALGCWLQIETAMRETALVPSQAAIVLGAAVWPGSRPSPALASRTERAVQLYQDGYVQWLATTGGTVGDYPSEGQVASQYAIELGVAPERCIVESSSTSTWTNLANLLPQLVNLGIDEVIIVSDGFHLARAERMALDLGLKEVQTVGCESVFSPMTILMYQLRELAAFMSYLYLGP